MKRMREKTGKGEVRRTATPYTKLCDLLPDVWVLDAGFDDVMCLQADEDDHDAEDDLMTDKLVCHAVPD